MKMHVLPFLPLAIAAALPNPHPVWHNALTRSISATKPTLPTHTYLGCKLDSPSPRLLPSKYTWSTNMTYASCSAFCGPNYEYLGLEYSTECYCGTSLPAFVRAANETECSMPCSGDAGAKCGGAGRIGVFRAKEYSPSAPGQVKGYAYRGCYADSVGERILKGEFYNGGNVTTVGCAGLCRGSTYFGVEYGGECYCGNTLSSAAKKVDDGQCKAQCKGSKEQACGDANRMSLYWKTPGA